MRMTPAVLVLAANLVCGGTTAAPDASMISHKVNELAVKLGVIGFWHRHFESLPRIKRTLFAIWILEAEVHNGGLWQYFYNSSGQMAPHICGILKSIGAEKAERIVRSAIEALGPNIPWDDEERRYPIIRDLSKERPDRLFDLEGQLYDQLDEINLLLFRYLSQHRDQIDVPANFWTEATLQ